MRVCYKHESETCYFIREDILSFVRLEHATGEYMTNFILDCLRILELPYDNVIGRGYDDAAAMYGTFKGVQAHIKKNRP